MNTTLALQISILIVQVVSIVLSIKQLKNK
jgi:hypothetical protein